MFSSSVSIGPEFFEKAFHDYSDRYWAFAREIMQNSIDCGSRNIWIEVHTCGDDTLVVVRNDGDVMDSDTITDKLLSLGSSGKDFKAGAVGGFGKAKEILYFAHPSYWIDSGLWTVEGSGAGYNLELRSIYHPGTTSGVVWEGHHEGRLVVAFEKFAAMSNFKGRIVLNGRELTERARRTRTLRPIEVDEGNPWGRLDRVQGEAGTLVVRVNGIPMFHRNTEYKGALAVEILVPSAEVLTSNRDGLTWEYRSQLDAMVTHLAVDKRSVLTVETPVYTRFEGPKLVRPMPVEPGSGVVSGVGGTLVMVAARMRPEKPASGLGVRDEVQGRSSLPPSVLGHEFILKNCLGRRVPGRFDPNSLKFDDHSHWLVRGWAGSLLELHHLSQCNDHFSVGFIFSGECDAEFERSLDYGPVYFLNPAKAGKKGKLIRRYTKSDSHRIVAMAAHEFVHGGLGEPYHDEDYANRLTELMGVVLAHWRRFARHFR